MKTFKTFLTESDSRSSHLCWGPGDLHHGVSELHSFDSAPMMPKTFHQSHGHPQEPISDEEGGRQENHFIDHGMSLSHRVEEGELPEHHPILEQSVSNYKKDSDNINRHLRRHEGDVSVVKQHIHQMHGSTLSGEHYAENWESHVRNLHNLTNHEMGEARTLYRGMHASFDPKETPVGHTFTDHGFTGTSLKPQVALSFAHDREGTTPDGRRNHKVMFQIHAPKGTRGLHIDHRSIHQFSHHEHASEHEVLLHRGTTFRVTGHTRHQGMTGPIHTIHLAIHKQRPEEEM